MDFPVWAKSTTFAGWLLFAALAGLLLRYALVFPSSIWAGDDYSPELLAAACNLGARLADWVLYPTATIGVHPGIQFYFSSWIVVWIAMGREAIGSDLSYFDRIVEAAPAIFSVSKVVTIGITLASVILYYRVASRLAPAIVVFIGLALWALSAPVGLFRSIYMATETFGLLANAILVMALILLARRPENIWTYVVCGCAVAFAYLLKLSYIYVYLAIISAVVALIYVRPRDWLRPAIGVLILHAVAGSIVALFVYEVIGRSTFNYLLGLHSARFTQASGVTLAAIAASLKMSLAQGSTSFQLAFVLGPLVCLVSGIQILRRRLSRELAVISVGAGVATVFAATVPLQLYNQNYALCVTATLPLLVVAAWSLAKESPLISRGILAAFALAAAVSATISLPTADAMFGRLVRITQTTADDEARIASLVRRDQTGLYLYRAQVRAYGEGYVAHYCSVPKISNELFAADRPVQSSLFTKRKDADYLIVDKQYNRTLDYMKSGVMLDPLKAVPVVLKDGDQVTELGMVWLVIRSQKTP